MPNKQKLLVEEPTTKERRLQMMDINCAKDLDISGTLKILQVTPTASKVMMYVIAVANGVREGTLPIKEGEFHLKAAQVIIDLACKDAEFDLTKRIETALKGRLKITGPS